jgi:hypothetical protein
LYSMDMEVVNKAGKRLYGSESGELETINSLGGTRVPCFARVKIGTDLDFGEYTMRVTITDHVAKPKVKKTLVRKFEVVKPELGFILIGLTNDQGFEAPPVAVPGQMLFLHCTSTGFELDKKKNLPNLAIEMRILDSDGKPTLPTPVTGEVKELKEKTYEQFIPWQMSVNVNRGGKFKIVLKLTDKNAPGGKSVELALDLNVVEVREAK